MAKKKNNQKVMSYFERVEAKKAKMLEFDGNNFDMVKYLHAPASYVKKNKDGFDIIVGGGVKKLEDEYDKCASVILNNTKFRFTNCGMGAGHYKIVEFMGHTVIEDEDIEKFGDIYVEIFTIMSDAFYMYSNQYGFNPEDFTLFVRNVMRPLSLDNKFKEAMNAGVYNNKVNDLGNGVIGISFV